MAEIDDTIDSLLEQVDEVAGDTRKWSQADSVEIYRAVASHCEEWARLIRSEMS